jgi:solute:Na+ symporter, SSS family
MVGLDYGIIALYLALLIWLGSSFASRQTTASEYFLISRTVPWWAVCFTVVATETSTLTFIGIPAQTYAAGGNLTFLQLALGYLAGRFIISVLFIPKYFAKQLLTSYEVLHDRFGAPVRNLGSAMFLVTRSAADGIRLFATSAVIATLVGVPIWVAIVVLGVAMIVYTFYGGAAAVIWTDVIQMFVYLAGAGIILWFALAGIPGGISEVLTFGDNTGRWTMFDLQWNFFSAYTFWAGLIGGVTLTLATHGTDQFLVQRLLTARSEREAQAGLSLSGILVFLQFGLFLFIGVALAAFYQYLPAPELTRGDMLIPTFVRDHVPAGLAGFVVAAIVAAALSPSINSLAATTVNDFYLKYWRPDADDTAMLRVAHRATIAWGLVQIGVALLATQLTQSVLDAGLAVLGLGAGPVLGAFLLAAMRRRFDPWHVAGGMLTAWVVVFSTYWFSPVAWPWYSTIGAGLTVTIALLPLRKVAPAGLALLLVSTGACGDGPAAETPTVPEGIEVSVAEARLSILRDVINANGEVTPAPEADWTVHASETAQIVDLPFSEGDRVEAGDVVVRFEVATRTAAIQSAEFDLSRDTNRLDAARARVQELTRLFENGLTARVALDAAKSEMAAADSQVSAGRISLEALKAAQARDVVRARFPGIIMTQYHYRGDVVTAGGQDPVLRIVDPTQIEVTLLVPVTEAGRLMVGQRLAITPLGFAPFTTMVRTILPSSISDDTMVRVRASMPAPAPGTPPAAAVADAVAVDADADAPTGPTVGTPVLGEILVAEVTEALVIPPQAILRAAGTPYVLVADQDGRASRRDIRLSVVTSQLAQVVEGLQVGDIVITSALTELVEGDRVRYSR